MKSLTDNDLIDLVPLILDRNLFSKLLGTIVFDWRASLSSAS